MGDFYAKGADVYNKIVKYSERYLLLESPYYLYMACFCSHEEVAEIQQVSGISLYSCDDGSVIANALWCNGRIDCRNSEDETHCSLCSEQSSVTYSASCMLPEYTCSMFYYQCRVMVVCIMITCVIICVIVHLVMI